MPNDKKADRRADDMNPRREPHPELSEEQALVAWRGMLGWGVSGPPTCFPTPVEEELVEVDRGRLPDPFSDLRSSQWYAAQWREVQPNSRHGAIHLPGTGLVAVQADFRDDFLWVKLGGLPAGWRADSLCLVDLPSPVDLPTTPLAAGDVAQLAAEQWEVLPLESSAAGLRAPVVNPRQRRLLATAESCWLLRLVSPA